MPSKGRWQATCWNSGLIIGAQMEVMMSKCKEKENWSSKRYEIIKLSFGDATLVIEILFIAAAHTDLLMALLKFLMMHK